MEKQHPPIKIDDALGGIYINDFRQKKLVPTEDEV